MRMVTMTKCKNANAYKVKIDDIDYNFFMTEDFILRLIRAYKILNKDPSKTVIITSDDSYRDYDYY